MSVLALKAIDYGAEQIPDKFFEKIPGGFFTPQEKKKIDKGRADKKAKERHQNEQRSSKRNSRRDRSPYTDHSDYSTQDDTDYDYERDRRKQDRSRRAKSAGRVPSESVGRGRDHRRSRGLDGEYSEQNDMAQPEQGSPYFPPPPSSDYRPYNPQVNIFPRSSTASLPTLAASSTRMNTPSWPCSPMLMSRPSSNLSSPFSRQSPMFDFLHCGTPVSATFSPSTEPPLAAFFARPRTNIPKSATGQPRSSASTARYTPGPGYAPSPINSGYSAPSIGPNTSYAPSPVDPGYSAHSVGPNTTYVPYNPADYTSNGGGGYQAVGGSYPSPPPFSRQRSNSQPTSPPYPTYIPPSAEQRVTAYDDQPSNHRRSTKSRREYRHRARSADTQSSPKDSGHDSHRDSSRMTKMRERFDEGLLREGGLVAAVGGALAGGLAGPQRSRSRSRSHSRSRHRHDGQLRSRDRNYERNAPLGLRARSKSIVDRFRSKSRGAEEREVLRKDSHNRPDRGYERPDHGYDRGRGDDYDSYSSESDGSPVNSRRHRKRGDY
ncbi:hypothetical protein GQ44DRAFT_746948 [Phaeosphaeriaceae sp. PMI808]|nr:hypothetical protein GQ44DRAFT_746948 [Phaeosphaeriaceae sp. PMI808]